MPQVRAGNLIVKFCYGPWANGPRQPRESTGGFLQAHAPVTSPLVAGQRVTFPNIPRTIAQSVGYPFSPAEFSFLSVIGGAEGPQLSITYGDWPETIPVAENDINVLVYYGPSASGIGVPWVVVDCFDQSTQQLVNDTFVSASFEGKPNLQYTNEANIN